MANMTHHCRILNARCIVDDRPPIINAAQFLAPTQIRKDQEYFHRIFYENTNLLGKVNQIQRIEGQVRPYNMNMAILKTRLPMVKKWLNKIEVANFHLWRKLFCAKPTLETRMARKATVISKKPKEQGYLRQEWYRKYQDILPVSNPRAIQILLYPKIYLDLGVLNIRPLDRLVVVLYTEAAPHVVLSFVKMCHADTKESLTFHRIFPNLWMEGCIRGVDDEGMASTNKSIGDHNQAGTLALLERESDPGYIQFSISFKPLKLLNGKRVTFGRVIEGYKGLDSLQDYGTKNGKTKKDIVVLGCGLIR